MQVLISPNNIQIVDSYTIKSRKEMYKVLRDIKEKHLDNEVFKISDTVLVAEWCAHNLLYNLGLYKNRTKDVDLNSGKTILEKVAYLTLALFYWK